MSGRRLAGKQVNVSEKTHARLAELVSEMKSGKGGQATMNDVVEWLLDTRDLSRAAGQLAAEIRRAREEARP